VVEGLKDFAKYGEFFICKNNYIHMAIKNENISQFGEFSPEELFLKNHPQKKKKKRRWVKRRGNEGCNEWEREPCCVWLSFAKYALRMWCALLNAISHTPAPPSPLLSLSLSLFLLARTRQRQRQAPLASPHHTTNPLPLVLSGSRPSEEQGSAAEMKRRQF
jgi:hypothetical protein